MHVAVTLSLIRAGILGNQAISIFQTQQECQHSVWTAFGDSEEINGGKEITLIYLP